MKVKKTSPGVQVVKMPKGSPSRPQRAMPLTTGGSKARMRHKGRTDPKAADPHDPGPTPMPSTKVNWPTGDKNAQKGYVVGRGWPTKTVQGAGPSPYSVRGASGGPEGGQSSDGANAQDMEGSYTESGQDTAE